MGLNQKRKDLVKIAYTSIILKILGRAEGTEESKNFQSSPKIITVEFNIFGVNQVNSFDISNSQISMRQQHLALPLKRKTSVVSGIQRACANACLEAGIFADGGPRIISWESILVGAGVYNTIA